MFLNKRGNMKNHPNLQRDRNIAILNDYLEMANRGEKNIHARLSVKYNLSFSRMPQIVKSMQRRLLEETLTK